MKIKQAMRFKIEDVYSCGKLGFGNELTDFFCPGYILELVHRMIRREIFRVG